jgi:hypothetical protein
MKAIILALILGVAGAMAWFAFRGECPDGQVFASEEACLASGQLPAGLCRQGFAEAQRGACIASSGKGRPVFQRIGSGSEPRGS